MNSTFAGAGANRPRLKIVHIITGLGTGGAEKMLLRLLQGTDRSQVESHVISLAEIGWIGGAMQDEGISVYSLNMEPNRFDPRGPVELIRLLRCIAPDVVQTWLYHADLMGGFAARLAGNPPVIWGIHLGNLDPAINKRSTLRIARLCARVSGWLPTAIVCCAESARRSHIAFGYKPKRMVVIPNGFNTSEFRPSPDDRQTIRTELGVPESAPLIGLIARFDPQKDHHSFVRAAGQVMRQRGDAHIVMCGPEVTRDNPRLMAWLHEAGIVDRYHLLGNREDVPRIQASLDLAVSSSLGEAFPLAIGEAMACGVPCVVTDVGDSAELVGETGRIVPAADPAALGTAILDLLNLSPEERNALGAAARERVATTYSLETAVTRYQHLYEQLAQGSTATYSLEGAR